MELKLQTQLAFLEIDGDFYRAETIVAIKRANAVKRGGVVYQRAEIVFKQGKPLVVRMSAKDLVEKMGGVPRAEERGRDD